MNALSVSKLQKLNTIDIKKASKSFSQENLSFSKQLIKHQHSTKKSCVASHFHRDILTRGQDWLKCTNTEMRRGRRCLEDLSNPYDGNMGA